MKLRTLAYFIVVLILLNTGCKKKNDIEEQRYLWSTDAPTTIPLRLRMQRVEKGNLIRNPSFETGKIFRLDSASSSFAIDGWQLVGKNVEWVNTENDSLYEAHEAFSGSKAVKISRQTAYETENEGAGILSDFIKVIPGNYSLSLYTKLENVKPNKARLGTRMYDGVELTLRFYDRNRNLLKSVFDYPIENQKIDASFKALSFANYKQIPSLGWVKITGKSHGFPFPEGDIPTEAHFVKIYIGLKGTGTLWIDSVSFNYTEKNLSAAERMQSFTDTAFHPAEMFIPTPKEITLKETIIFGSEVMSPGELPVIVISDASLNDAANLVRDALAKRLPGKAAPAIVSDVTRDQLDSSRLIISIGKTPLYGRFQKMLPEKEIESKPQGYFIYTPDDAHNIVLLGSATNQGLYYAALTAGQMIDATRPYFHNTSVIDYPDYENRYCSFLTGVNYKQQIPELIRYKINGAFLVTLTAVKTAVMPSLPATAQAPGRQAGGVEAFFSLRPVSGYVPPSSSTLTYEYPYTVKSDTIIHPADIFSFPAVFHNEMLDNSDYAEMCCQLPLSGKRIYSGSSFFSINTDEADVRRFESIFGPSPVFMDNSMLMATQWAKYGGNDPYYPGKVRLFNLFEPFSNSAIRELRGLLDTSAFAVNLPPSSEIEIIRLATAADFMWNMNAYSMDYSLWKVLVSRYGVQNARNLVLYADQYSMILETIIRLENNMQVARNLKAGQVAITRITSLTAEISTRLGSQHKLIKALQGLNTGLRNRLNSNLNIKSLGK